MRQKTQYTFAVAIFLCSLLAAAQQGNPDSTLAEEQANDIRRGLSPSDRQRNEQIEIVSPARRIGRNHDPVITETLIDSAYRSINGSGNNLRFNEMNSGLSPLRRWFPAAYADGISALAGAGIAGPREISNAVAAQSESIPNSAGATDFLWQWGQFLDHDFALTEGDEPAADGVSD